VRGPLLSQAPARRREAGKRALHADHFPEIVTKILPAGTATRILARVEGFDDDPWLEAQLDAAVAPYAGRLSAEEIAWMRERLFEALVTERRGQELVRRARPRVVERSGEVRADGAAEAQDPGPRERGRTG
jgi:hypothetical protein